jgi:hypothetical protein
MVNNLEITVEGILAAAVSGFATCLGYVMIMEPDSSTEKLVKRAAGGAVFVVGLYLWAPTWLRGIWLTSLR